MLIRMVLQLTFLIQFCISIQMIHSVSYSSVLAFLWRVCIVWAEQEANKTNNSIILHLRPQHVLYEYVWPLSVKQCQAMIYSA